MPEFMGSRFNYRVGEFDHLSKTKNKNLSHQNFQKLKNQRKKMYLRGALDSAQFFLA
jgi:hypothetical protein